MLSEEEQDKLLEARTKKNSPESPESPEKELHKQKLAELSEHRRAIEELVDGYFQPPNLMAISGEKWDLFVRRKGSDTEFGPSEWKGE